jgi:hypothetical protein
MKYVREIDTETAVISKLESGVIRVAIKDNAHLEAKNLEENYKAYLELMDGDRAPFLIIVNDSATISTEGRKKYNEETRKEVRQKDALVMKDPSTMLLINSQVKFIKPIIPMRAFLDEPHALNWLLNE